MGGEVILLLPKIISLLLNVLYRSAWKEYVGVFLSFSIEFIE